jgi:hypothetical protein
MSIQSIAGEKEKGKGKGNEKEKSNMQFISSEDFKGSQTEGVKKNNNKSNTNQSSFLPLKEEPVKEVAMHKKKLA